MLKSKKISAKRKLSIKEYKEVKKILETGDPSKYIHIGFNIKPIVGLHFYFSVKPFFVKYRLYWRNRIIKA